MATLGYPEPALTSPTVTLRPWGNSDAESLAAAWDDAQIQATCGVPASRTTTDAERWISGHLKRASSQRAIDLVITDDDGRVVRGEVGLGPFDQERRAAMVGFWIGADYRGCGYASAAVGLVASWVFAQGLTTLVAQTTADNIGSIGVLQAAGFRLLDAHETTGAQRWIRQTPDGEAT